MKKKKTFLANVSFDMFNNNLNMSTNYLYFKMTKLLFQFYVGSFFSRNIFSTAKINVGLFQLFKMYIGQK